MAKNKYGWTPSLPDARDVMYSHVRNIYAAALPEKVNLAKSEKLAGTSWTKILNQGNLGSCGPHTAAVDLIHSALYRENQVSTPLPSVQYIYWFTRYIMGTINQDSGVQNRALMKALFQYGWCDEQLCPYDIPSFRNKPSDAAIAQAKTRRITKYAAIDQNLDVMRGALANGDTFIFGFSVYESFESDRTEQTGDVSYPSRGEQQLGGHDVLICGYDDQTRMFDFRNSYSSAWGNGGYGRIPYEYATNPQLAGDFWSALDDGNNVEPKPTPEPTPNPSQEQWKLTIAGKGEKPVIEWK